MIQATFDLSPPPRERFRQLLGQLSAEHKSFSDAREALEAEWVGARLQKASELTHKPVKDVHKANGYLQRVGQWDEALKPFAARAELLSGAHDAKIKDLRQRLTDLAAQVKVESGDTWLLLREISGTSYNSQGFGADAYARGAAELEEIEAQAAEVPTRILSEHHEIKHPSWHSTGGWTDYRVEVQVKEQLDVELIRRKQHLGLRDWLKACWKRGINPRVLNPYLPHGLEEKFGIDYHGNDIPKKG
jgi:hypothetical protein